MATREWLNPIGKASFGRRSLQDCIGYGIVTGRDSQLAADDQFVGFILVPDQFDPAKLKAAGPRSYPPGGEQIKVLTERIFTLKTPQLAGATRATNSRPDMKLWFRVNLNGEEFELA